jgi:hypothetical protein
MMPLRVRRKARNLEKIENLYCSATARKILPARINKSDHICAIPWTSTERIAPHMPPRG